MDMQIDKERIKEIIDRVLEKIGEETRYGKRKTVVLFQGALAGFEEALLSLKRLKESGIGFYICYTESAGKVLDMERIVKDLDPEDMICASQINPAELAAQTELLILPTATVQSVSKIAACMTDSTALAYILRVLMLKKRVILAKDGCCPDMIEQRTGTPMPDAIRIVLITGLKQMHEFGAEIITAKDICSIAGGYKCDYVRIDRKLVDRELIEENKTEQVLLIRKDALLTQLAGETAANYGIRLVRE